METVEYLKAQIDILQKNLSSHTNCDYWKSENGRVQSQLIDLVDNHYNSYNGEGEAEDIITAICEIIDYSPTKEINFTATMSFSGTIQVPANEDIDLEEILGEAYVDINHGDVVIDNYELYDANEC